jgi:hypothetical protein
MSVPRFIPQDFFSVKEKLFYITPQPSRKHIIIEFPGLQYNILKNICTRPAKNVMFYLAAP